MSVAFAGATKAHEPLYFSAGHLAELGESFDYAGYRDRLKALPRMGAEEEEASLLQAWMARAPSLARRLSPDALAAAVLRFQAELTARVGRSIRWHDQVHEDTAVGNEGAYIHRLDPRGMGQLTLLAAARLAGTALADVVSLEDPWSHPDFDRSQKALTELAPQLSLIDINNLLVPVDCPCALHGLPYRIGSAPALEREIRSLVELMGLELETWPDGPIVADPHGDAPAGPLWNLEVLLRGAMQSRELKLPMFVEG